MSGDQKNTMVTVKKSDGTMVRVPLSQLKASATPVKSEPPKPVKIVPKEELSLPPPLPKIALPKEKLLSRFTKEDAISPLQEELPKTVGTTERTSHRQGGASESRLDQAADIIKKLSFKVPDDFANRLRSVIQLRLKDVRGAEATKEGLMRSRDAGGLGLNEAQADEVVNACKSFTGGFGMEPKFIKSVLPPPRPQSPAPQTAPIAPLPAIKPPPLPVTPPSAPATRELRPQEARPVIQDVVISRVEVGPVEEIRQFNLTEFRRLSSNPKEAASRLRQKFINLRDESYLLYMDARKAWQESPLFTDYMLAVKEALLGRQTLATVLGERAKIQLPEIKAIVEMEYTL